MSFYIRAVSVIVCLIPCLALAQAPESSFRDGEIHTMITTSSVHRYKVVVAPMKVEGLRLADSSEKMMSIRNIIIDDLDFSLRFDALNRRVDEFSLASLSSSKGRVDFNAWQATGAEYLVAGSFIELERIPMVEIRVYDLGLEDLVFLRNYTVDFAALRRTAHHISDDIVFNVTGERGVASTLIAFRMHTGKGTSEIFYSDYDGYGLAGITSDSSIAMMPSWSPDGRKIAYTSFKSTDQDLYSVDLKNKKNSPLRTAKGVDMAAVWCESNGFLCFSSGVVGNQEIYYLRPGEGRPVRITFSYAMDIEPFWSPNGEEIVFASTRAGNPHIFIMGSDGLNVRRITFESRNTTPRWRPLPYGDKILLTSEIRGIFQIAVIDVNGDNFIQLTTDRENRYASWSPDGLHIVFSSDRRGGWGNFELFTMDWDGNSQRPLRKKFSPAREPAWSPFLER